MSFSENRPSSVNPTIQDTNPSKSFTTDVEETDEVVEKVTTMYVCFRTSKLDPTQLTVAFEDDNGDFVEDDVSLEVLEMTALSYGYSLVPLDED